MTLNAATFMRERPEFESAGVQLITSHIALAAQRLSSSEHGSAYDQALSLMTAHLLWDSPFGASMRRDGGEDAASPYLKELKSLQLERIPRIAVL